MVSKAMTRPEDEIIPWLPTPLRSRLKAFRETEDFKKRSRQNSINKRTGPKAGTVHIVGSISAEQTARKMVIRDNKIPKAAKLFEQIHSRKKGNEKVFCDKRAKSIWDEHQRLKLNASHSRVEVNDDALFLQAAGGVNSKEDLLNATRAELTRTKEEVKQTKDAIVRIESRLGGSSS
ncbi:hypothetical protein Cgig2_002372 [Carnegiea gigantea]|uniref:Uncharacterized protein n=1 Tax=Carnegiea gigantea TaxID=171969 RepID=A0A9Q1QCA4_9CARY|nr:hypothetical protein Cgig2_002372 [Carnegiea gigantea]